MTATSHGDLDVVFTAETYTGDDVGDVSTAGDGSGPLVDHAVVDGARVVVAGVSRGDQVAAHGGGQVYVRRGGGAG